jgi:ribosome-binding factor A
MTVGRRLQQVADLLRAELASLVQQNLRDPRVGFVTVTGVRLSPDLGSARVYVTVLGDPGREEEALEALGRAAGYLRRELAGRVHLRKVPQLSFHSDASIRQGARIEDLLSDLKGPETEEE